LNGEATKTPAKPKEASIKHSKKVDAPKKIDTSKEKNSQPEDKKTRNRNFRENGKQRTKKERRHN
jgi:hypothetical protein